MGEKAWEVPDSRTVVAPPSGDTILFDQILDSPDMMSSLLMGAITFCPTGIKY